MLEKIKAWWAALTPPTQKGTIAGIVLFLLLLLTLWAGSCAKVWNTNVVRSSYNDHGNDTKGWCASCRKTCAEKGL